MYGRSQDQEPIIRSYPDQPTFRPSSQLGRLSSLERPTYFTPTPGWAFTLSHKILTQYPFESHYSLPKMLPRLN